MDIKVEIQPKEINASVKTPNEPIYGGTKDYTKLDNLPSINGSVIIGDMTLLQLGIQPQGDYAERSELPVNVSELYNDAGYLVQSDLSDYAKTENIPTKVSQLENDSDYATTMQIPTKTSQLSNDSEFAYTKDIPTKVSQIENDSNYAEKSDLPTKTSQLLNDSNIAYVTDIPTNTSELENDSNFAYVSDIPTKFSELENDSLKNVDNTSDENKPVSIAQRKAIDDAYANSNAYTDQKIADLIGGAPETLDTLKEVADAIAESKDVEEALNSAIGKKANQTELDTHTENDTIHITSTERENWNDANDKKHSHSNKSILDKITQTLLDNWNAAYNHISDTIKHITSDERRAWNNKYDKPDTGIPKSDLSNEVHTSLGKADTALQEHQDISGLATKTELNTHTNNKSNPHSVTKSHVGLGNCDNTSDADKPISKAQQAEFDNVNNNLDGLQYSDVAGGKNIFNQSVIDKNNPDVKGIYLGYRINANNQYTISITEKDSSIDISGIFFGVTRNGYNSEDGYEWLIINGSIMNNSLTVDSSYEFISFYKDNDLVGIVEKILQKFNIQIEYGQATEYEPYIPSVKMLSEKTTQIDDLNILGWVVPEECPIKNYVDSDGVFHQRVGRVDLGNCTWSYVNGIFRCDPVPSGLKTLAKIYCTDYATSNLNYENMPDKNVTTNYDKYTTEKPFLIIKDSSYTDATAFKNAMQGIYLYYELAEEKTIAVDGNEAVTKVNDSLGAYAITNDMLEIGHWWNGGDTTNVHIRVKKEYALQSGFKGYVTNNTEKLLAIIKYNEDAFFDYVTEIEVGKTILVEVPSGSNYRMYEEETDFSKIASNIIIATNGLGKEVAELKNDLVSLKNLFSSNITGIKLNGTTLEVSFNNGTSKGIVTFDGIAEEETIIS